MEQEEEAKIQGQFGALFSNPRKSEEVNDNTTLLFNDELSPSKK